MTRKSIIILSILLAIIAAIIPLLFTLYFSWLIAEKNEHYELSQLAKRALQRATISFEEANDILKTLAKLQYTGCSKQHIDQIRQLAFNSLNIDEIGYFEKDILKCSSWGEINKKIKFLPPTVINKEGIEITLDVYPLVSQKRPVISFFYKNHNVLVDPSHFTDVITEPGVQVAITLKTGEIISTHNNPDPHLINQIIKGDKIKDYVFFILKTDNVFVITIEPHAYLLTKLYQEFKVLLPFGLLMMISFVAAVVWASRRRLSLLGELKTAIAQHKLIVYYQPLMDLATGACIGAEALVRWPQPDGSLRRPDLFIPLAEENGLIQAITDQVVATAAADLKTLLVANRHLHIAINFAAEDFKTGRMLDVVQKAFAGTGVEPQQVWLEATERGFMEVDAVRKTILKAKEMGHPVMIDDFGTGYSSLSYLQGLPINALKIDKSFIDAIGRHSATSHVTFHIIKMAKALQLKIIAEGVENEYQADYLRKHEVEYGQGWLFAKAMPVDEFIDFCRRHKGKIS